MRKLKCAVIGAGNMGRHHIRTLAELEEQVVLTAICDHKEDAGRALAGQHGAAFYLDYLELLKQEELDIVSICVPTSLHHRVGQDCIAAGLNVLLEKPLCHRVEAAAELLELAGEKEIILLVGHTERFNPAVVKANELIDSGAIGAISLIKARRLGGLPERLEGNDIAFDLAIHDIDIINLLLNDRPIHVAAQKCCTNLIDQADQVVFSLRYESAQAQITASWANAEKIRQMEIIGSKGRLELDYLDQTVALCSDLPDASRQLFTTPRQQPLKEELMHLINCVRKNHRIDNRFALDALRIATCDDGKVGS